MKILKICFVLCTVHMSTITFGDTCPVSPLKIEPKLNAEVSFNKKENSYTYTYTLENGPKALLPIFLFRIMLNEMPVEIKSPPKWIGNYENDGSDPDFPKNIEWDAPKYFLKAGERVEGFTLKSSYPPGLVKYYATTLPGIPTVTSTPDSYEPEPNCPGFFFDRPVLEGYVNGVTQGPVPLNQISVELKLKKVKISVDGKNKNELDEDLESISPYNESGNIAVILKSQKDLDVKTVNIATVQFGTGKAPVLESNILRDKNNEHLRMVFDLSKLLIECDRDRVLFFSAKTTTGKELLGATPIKTVNCDIKPRKKKMK